ncbi:hypothetical protein NSE01_19900 [Novosphingobium sediminis]|uniref:Lipoprotein n=1 Tax=Novosphingobium sediminis TaxID=707214 RepID=A0A512AKD2_9SPHN|nr:hypothetical protein [Novosphingobium sediminis]GEO00158.1 hypothetical protein NSE01_19900 [Novosphingobium sediminis]
MIRLLPTRTVIAALAPLLFLGACGKSSGPQAGSTASGEILPGSVSDAMLDTDRSQAQAPLAPAAHTAAKVDAGASADAADAAADIPTTPDGGPADAAPAAPKAAASPKPATP